MTDGTYGSQLFKSPRFIPHKLREPNANLRPRYVRTPWEVVKGESPLKRVQKQLDPDPRWDLSFILWEIGIGSIKRKRNCDLWDLSCVSRKLGKPPDPCWDLSCVLGKIGRDNPHWDLSCGLRKMGKPDLLRKNGTELKVLQPPGGGFLSSCQASITLNYCWYPKGGLSLTKEDIYLTTLRPQTAGSMKKYV